MTKWKLVPCEPTDEMVVAGDNAIESYDGSIPGDLSGVVSVYSAMLAPSPSPGEDVVQQAARRHCEEENGDGRCACANNNAGACHGRMATVRAVLAALEG